MTKNTPKQDAVNLAMEQIKKQYGKGAIMRLGEKPLEKIEVLPTGIFALDLALGVGGIPKGRVVEIFGPEASGKTTLCLHIVASAQKSGGTEFELGDLATPQINIAYGSWYLRYLLDRYGENELLALAARQDAIDAARQADPRQSQLSGQRNPRYRRLREHPADLQDN